jgi:hypothetical protein
MSVMRLFWLCMLAIYIGLPVICFSQLAWDVPLFQPGLGRTAVSAWLGAYRVLVPTATGGPAFYSCPNACHIHLMLHVRLDG